MIHAIIVHRFLSSLAVVAGRPELLQKIILTKDVCNEGAYHVKLCKDGCWQVVLLDDQFPCDQYNNLKYSKVDSTLKHPNLGYVALNILLLKRSGLCLDNI